MLNITVIGAGEVFQNRYLMAARSVGILNDLVISDVVDVRPSSEIIDEIRANDFNTNICTHQLLDTTPQGLIELLKRKNLINSPAIIATPSPLHIPYGLAMLKEGMFVAIEKPFSISKTQIDQFDKFISRVGTERLFLLGYYALEKGLAALALAKANNKANNDVLPSYLQLLEPSVEPQLMRDIRSNLGKVKCIRGVLLEGEGNAGRLDQRSWVLNSSSGGNTVETFYHLVCMSLPFLGDISRIKILDVSLSSHKKTTEWFYETSGKQSAETLTVAHLVTDEAIEVRLLCAKYVPQILHERWMEIEFENGKAFANFETGILDIEGKDFDLSLKLRYQTKYTTQFILFSDKICRPKQPIEYNLFRDALLLTLNIREHGLKNGLNQYTTEDITRQNINVMLGLQPN